MSVPVDVCLPPDRALERPPTESRLQALPFSEITWTNFERLLYRIASSEADVEHCSRYGRQGQSQEGIDVYTRLQGGKYACWQAKNHQAFTVADVKAAVNSFRQGDWYKKSERFVLCVRAGFDDVKVQSAIETEAAQLRTDGILLDPIGPDHLTDRLRTRPDLIDDFFGREWVKALLGGDVAHSLSRRLSGNQVALLRSKLGQVYDARIRSLDPGLAIVRPGVAVRDLRERFVTPDVSAIEPFLEPSLENADEAQTGEILEGTDFDGDWPEDHDDGRSIRFKRRQLEPAQIDGSDNESRIALEDWLLESSNRTLLLAGAGLGKSTVLRCLALDLLTTPKVFKRFSSRQLDYIPLLIPFAYWTRISARTGSEVSIQDVVKGIYGPFMPGRDLDDLVLRSLDDSRLLLLIDGLDEYAEEQAARTTLVTLETFAIAHQIPILATGRPAGVRRLGLTGDWRMGRLVELSVKQQRLLTTHLFGEVHAESERSTPAVALRLAQQVDQFFHDIDGGTRLKSLAGTPLLLTGLVSIAIRHAILPRTRFQLFEQLVTLLLEDHPSRRASSAAEMQPRTGAFANDDLRREALSRLAFQIQFRGEDAGVLRNEARRIIEEYLSDSNGPAWSRERAHIGAASLTSVNAETSGLLIERSPSELAFCHAAFREHLAGLELSAWSMNEQVSFVTLNGGNPRWKGAILAMIQKLSRPSDQQSILGAIVSGRSSAEHRNSNGLLADAVLSIPNLRGTLPREIAEATLDYIEDGASFSEARDLLGLVMDGPREGPVGELLKTRIATWWPCVSTWRYRIYPALLGWPKSPAVFRAIWLGLLDDEAENRWRAAESIAKYSAGDAAIFDRLAALSARTENPNVAAVALFAMSNGWPDHPEIGIRLSTALTSQSLTLSGVAASELCRRGDRSDSIRDALLEVVHDDHIFAESPLVSRAIDLLATEWRGSDFLIRQCLATVQDSFGRRTIKYDLAPKLLMRCGGDDPRVVAWCKSLFARDSRLSYTFRDALEPIGEMIQRHDDVRVAAESWLLSDPKRRYDFSSAEIAVAVHTEKAKQFLLSAISERDSHIYWEVGALLEGWGMDDADVSSVLAPLLTQGTRHLEGLASFVPDIERNRGRALELLDSIASMQSVDRPDYLIRGYCKLRPKLEGREVVDRVLRLVPGPIFVNIGVDDLIENFPDDLRVRALARALLGEREAPLYAVAKSYGDDSEMRLALLERISPLSTRLRRFIAQRASDRADDEYMLSLLSKFDVEDDPHAKIRAAIGYARAMDKDESQKTRAVGEFKELLHVNGPDMAERALAGFSGLIAIGSLNTFVSETQHHDGKPVSIELLHSFRDVEPALEIVAESWEMIEALLPESAVGRLSRLGGGSQEIDWNQFAPYVAKSSTLQSRFLEFCARDVSVLTSGSLEILARLNPRSPLTYGACKRALVRKASDRQQGAFEIVRARITAARILARLFPDEEGVLPLLVEATTEEFQCAGFIGLALLDPAHDSLKVGLDALRKNTLPHRTWYVAMALSGGAGSPEGFCDLLKHYVVRTSRSTWDFSRTSLELALARLGRDKLARDQLLEMAKSDPHPSFVVSTAQVSSLRNVWLDDNSGSVEWFIEQERKLQGTPRFGLSLLTNRMVPVLQTLMALRGSD